MRSAIFGICLFLGLPTASAATKSPLTFGDSWLTPAELSGDIVLIAPPEGGNQGGSQDDSDGDGGDTCDDICSGIEIGCITGALVNYGQCLFEAGNTVSIHMYLEDVAICMEIRSEDLDHCDDIASNCERACNLLH